MSGRARLTVSAAEGMRAAVLAGLGLGIASGVDVRPELASGEVVAVLPAWQLPRWISGHCCRLAASSTPRPAPS